MRILLLTQLFQPEPNHLKGIDFARELARRDNEIQVLTGFPNYPAGRIYPGYRQRLVFEETLGGIPIVRVPVFPSHSSSGIGRALNYLSFMFSAVFPGLFQIRRPDVVHVYQGPATLALPAMILRFVLRVPYVLDIQDLWPESVISSGMLKLKGATGILRYWSRLTYRYAQRIVVLSPGYKKALIERGVDGDKVEVVYNWSDERAEPDPACLQTARKLVSGGGFFSVVYAGNMGQVQALGAVIDAAGILDRKGLGIRFYFVGDGADADNLKKKMRLAGIRNIEFVPRQSSDMARGFIQEADAVLVHLRDDDLGRIGIPQKIQAYLAAGRPIIMAMRGNAAELVRMAESGIVCEPEDPESIASAVERLARLPKDEREALGRSGRRFYEQHLSFNVGVNRMVDLFAASVR